MQRLSAVFVVDHRAPMAAERHCFGFLNEEFPSPVAESSQKPAKKNTSMDCENETQTSAQCNAHITFSC